MPEIHFLLLKISIFSGFAAYFLYTVRLYFMMVPQLNISRLYLPVAYFCLGGSYISTMNNFWVSILYSWVTKTFVSVSL